MQEIRVLQDPCNDRQVKEAPLPPQECLPSQLLWQGNKPDWQLLRDFLQKEGRISKKDCLKILDTCNQILKSEPNLLSLNDPVTVVGDIHGQFYDMLRMFESGGDPNETKYLFLGDYVDRGSFSVEVVLLLYSLKINYPDTVFLLRGNHECRQMTAFFNFRTEVITKYDSETYERFMESFDQIPISCLVNEKFIALHGGISPDLETLDDINKLNRFEEPGKSGMFCDILWSDPVDNEDGDSTQPFYFNEVRGCSFFYGQEAVNDFLKKNELLSVIRAHEAQLDGYKMHRWNGSQEFPIVITIFSAPNYCDVYNNKAAIIKFKDNTLNIQQFNYTPHPYMLPNFMDIFTWSMPFVSEKVAEMLFNILQPKENTLSESDSDEEETENGVKISPRERLQKGPRSIIQIYRKQSVKEQNKLSWKNAKDVCHSKVMIQYRENHEIIIQLKGMCPGHRIPMGLLIEGKEALQNAIQAFRNAKKWDKINEKRPEEGEGKPSLI